MSRPCVRRVDSLWNGGARESLPGRCLPVLGRYLLAEYLDPLGTEGLDGIPGLYVCESFRSQASILGYSGRIGSRTTLRLTTLKTDSLTIQRLLKKSHRGPKGRISIRISHSG